MQLTNLYLPVFNSDIREWLMQRAGVHEDETHSTYAELYNFLWRHPNAEEKLRDVQRIIVKVRATRGTSYPEVFLQTAKGDLVDISWRKCISRKEESSHSKLMRAMRNSIRFQITQFSGKASPNITCELCDCLLGIAGVWHVDHVVQFKTLAATFLLHHPETSSAIVDDKNGHPTLNEESSVWHAWYHYHAAAAVLRVVHGDCNLRRPRSGDE